MFNFFHVCVFAYAALKMSVDGSNWGRSSLCVLDVLSQWANSVSCRSSQILEHKKSVDCRCPGLVDERTQKSEHLDPSCRSTSLA